METIDIFMVSYVPPPIGGIATWTRHFLQAAPGHGLRVRLRTIGPRADAEIQDPRARAGRFFRDFVKLGAELLFGAADRARVVHVCSSGGLSFLRALALVPICRARRKAVVVHLHSDSATCPPGSLALARALSQGPGILFVTPSHEDAARLPYFQQLDHFIPRSFTAGHSWPGPGREGPLRLLYLGWIIRTKGLFELAEAVARVPGVEVAMYGICTDGQTLGELERRCAELGIHRRMRYCGPVSGRQIPPLLCGHDALVLPSYRESFGLVAAEAMSLGLPVIATRAGFMWDIEEGVTLPLRARDAADLERVLREVAADRRGVLERVGARGRRYARERLSEQAVVPRWRQLYAQLL
jgi:glycosyltransferase involved in cell wall biosynthesis